MFRASYSNARSVGRGRHWLTALVVGLSVAGLALLLARPPVSRAATLVVTSTADSGPGTLRDAIASAASGDTITFSLPANSTITLTSGELVINKNLTIQGPGADLLTVKRSSGFFVSDFQIFSIRPISANISGLTITNGSALRDSGGFLTDGGGINNTGALKLTNCTISGNSSSFRGGGIWNGGTLTITNSTISGNISDTGGGGIYNVDTVTITNSTISSNISNAGGGGISSPLGLVTITNSTITGNTAVKGGGIDNRGAGTVDNASLTITNSTVTGNTAGSGGGGGISNDGIFNVRSSIIARNTATTGPDVRGALTTQGFNLIGNIKDATISTDPFLFDRIGTPAAPVDPLFETDAAGKPLLKDNGGPTRTIALLAGSPAIDRGDSSGSSTDQRGFPRPVGQPGPLSGDGSDKGAYEVQLPPDCNTISVVVNNNNDSGPSSLRDIIASACAGSTITFDMSRVVSPINLTSGELLINKNLTIKGPGANLLTVRRGAGNFRIFNIASSSVNAFINGLTIANGSAPGDLGGGILNGGLSSNGGGTVTITNCSISGNTAAKGGGIYNGKLGTVTITNSTISGNSANGGGINNDSGTVTITNSTISGNSAGSFGGGIYNFSTLTITHSTVTGNTSGSSGGGGISNDATVNARNTIIARNTATTGPDVRGALTSQGFNLIGNIKDATISPAQFSDQIGTAASPIDPLLDTLRDNGGPTFTHALLSGSTAIDRGHSSGSNTDQRGFTRPVGNPPSPNPNGGDGSDIGAFEVQAPVNTPPTITAAPTLSRQQSSAATTSTIATVSDAETPAGNLIVTVTSAPAGISVTNLVNTNGTITADVAASCAATVGANMVGLQVTDGGGATATANLTVNVTATTFTINPTAQNFTASGGAGSVSVTASASCPWTAQSNAPSFITINSGASGSGNGTVSYSVTANQSTSQRTGTMTIAGQTFTVTQDGAACSYNISPTSNSVSAAAAAGSVTVTATPGCAWTATSNASFITVPPGTSGTDNGTVNYSVSANSGPQRSGTLTIAGQTFTVTQAAPLMMQFSSAGYSVNEGDGRVTLTVTRTGDTSNASSVDYQTADTDTFTVGCADTVNNQGGAYGRCDFATVVATLTFAPGDTSRTLTVPIIDDAHVEGDETFQVKLMNGGSATIGPPATATVTIHDNDVPGEPNPIFFSPFFVRQHYLDFLSREPEPSGQQAWLNVLNNCSDVNNNPSCDRILVSQSFFGSQEFQLKGFYVFRFYKLAFNRLPEYLEIIPDMSFVAGATPEEVFARKAQLAVNFTTRQEFLNAYGPLSNANFVNTLMTRYQLTQITTPDPANPDGTQKVTLTSADLINQLNNNTLSRAQVLRAIADSDQVSAAEFNNAFVAMQYYGYLRRKPEPAGYNAWLGVLQGGDIRTMVSGFMNSAEYRLRFGSPNP